MIEKISIWSANWMFERIEEYIEKVINFNYKSLLVKDDALKLKETGVKVIFTGSYVLNNCYNVLERDPSDIDVIILVPDVYTFENIMFSYEQEIGVYNIRRSDYSNENLAVLRTVLNNSKIEFFIKTKLVEQEYTVIDKHNVMSIESIFKAKWQMNPFKAFKDELEMEEVAKKPKIDLPF